MLDLTVIILTFNEELHIRRCLERILPIAKRVVIVDSLSTDQTKEICAEYPRVDIVEHQWPGIYGTQFNWALDNVTIETEWVMRLDADEYLMPGEHERLSKLIMGLGQNVCGICLLLERFFMSRRIRYGGTSSIPLMRVFRRGCARCESREMDEHLELIQGEVYMSDIHFADDSKMPITQWIQKHLGYAERESVVLLRGEKKVKAKVDTLNNRRKVWYSRCPLFWRAFAYFFYRYIIRLGFLDGREGFLWHFMQAWWYRTLVDTLLTEKQKQNNTPS